MRGMKREGHADGPRSETAAVVAARARNESCVADPRHGSDVDGRRDAKQVTHTHGRHETHGRHTVAGQRLARSCKTHVHFGKRDTGSKSWNDVDTHTATVERTT